MVEKVDRHVGYFAVYLVIYEIFNVDSGKFCLGTKSFSNYFKL